MVAARRAVSLFNFLSQRTRIPWRRMEFSLEQKTASLSVGEFADFALGPRESNGGPRGIWRAQLGTHWHLEFRAQATAEHATAATFEIPVSGQIFHRGWTFTLTGRI